jgi:hypothetical protein
MALPLSVLFAVALFDGAIENRNASRVKIPPAPNAKRMIVAGKVFCFCFCILYPFLIGKFLLSITSLLSIMFQLGKPLLPYD